MSDLAMLILDRRDKGLFPIKLAIFAWCLYLPGPRFSLAYIFQHVLVEVGVILGRSY